MNPFLAIPFLLAAAWLFFAGSVIVGAIRRRKRSAPLSILFALMMAVGAIGFFGAGAAAVGSLKLPKSFEWPAGYVRGVCTLTSGNRVVPLEPVGRIQLYDPQWRFLRGWQVGASGGSFNVVCGDDSLEVFTARGRRHFVFDESGSLLSTSDYTARPDRGLPSGPYIVVPTRPIGWIFSSPFFTWSTALLGVGGLVLLRKFDEKFDHA
jgi:hypothetical protein